MRVSDAASIWMTTWNSSSLFLRHARAHTHTHTHKVVENHWID